LHCISLLPGLRHSRFPLPRPTAKKPLRSKQRDRGLCRGERYDPINDQETAEIRLELQDESLVDELFNEQLPSELAANSQTNRSPSAITMCNQPTKISDDQLRKSVRSLKKMRPKAYNRVLSWTRNNVKNTKSLKSQNVELVYSFMTGGGDSMRSDLIKTIYHIVVKTYRHDAPMNHEKPTASLAAFIGVAAINIDGTTIKTALAISKNTGDVLSVTHV